MVDNDDTEWQYQEIGTSVDLIIDGEPVAEVSKLNTDFEPIEESLMNRDTVGEYEGSFEFEIEDEHDLELWLNMMTPSPEHSWFGEQFGRNTNDRDNRYDTGGTYQESDTSVEDLHHHAMDQVAKSVDNAYKRGLLDGVFFVTLMCATGILDGTYQKTDIPQFLVNLLLIEN